MKERYSDYAEIKLPEQKGFMSKMFGTLIGNNSKKAKITFDVIPEMPPKRSDYTEEELSTFGSYQPTEQDELRKKKITKSKTKRKTTKKNCGCK